MNSVIEFMSYAKSLRMSDDGKICNTSHGTTDEIFELLETMSKSVFVKNFDCFSLIDPKEYLINPLLNNCQRIMAETLRCIYTMSDNLTGRLFV